jgi:riboflavin kinase/FMN adenylyltransferase
LEVVRGTAELKRRLVRPVLTIGNFDGLHVGHRAIMQTVSERARALDGEAVVYTFEPHPRKVLTPDRAPRLLMTLEQKLELLEVFGIDCVILEPFGPEFSRVSPDRFVREYIHERIGPVEVYVGYDFHYGRDREGSMRLLTETGPQLGFSVTIIGEVKIGERDVNSTRVRELLEQGRVEEVAKLLGRPFAARGRIGEGRQLGRRIGFPTANLVCENEVLPASGVYGGEVLFLDDGEPGRGARFPCVANVGYRPTFDDARGLVAEAHLLDFDGELYGRRVDLEFVCHLREERRFEGPEALRVQIERDVAAWRERLEAP